MARRQSSSRRADAEVGGLKTELPNAFSPRHCESTREVALFRAFLDAPTDANRNAIVEHFLPLALAVAIKQRGRRPYLGDLETILSDAYSGLFDAIEKIAEGKAKAPV